MRPPQKTETRARNQVRTDPATPQAAAPARQSATAYNISPGNTVRCVCIARRLPGLVWTQGRCCDVILIASKILSGVVCSSRYSLNKTTRSVYHCRALSYATERFCSELRLSRGLAFLNLFMELFVFCFFFVTRSAKRCSRSFRRWCALYWRLAARSSNTTNDSCRPSAASTPSSGWALTCPLLILKLCLPSRLK